MLAVVVRSPTLAAIATGSSDATSGLPASGLMAPYLAIGLTLATLFFKHRDPT